MRRILTKSETVDELMVIAKAARDLDKMLDKLFDRSAGEMLVRLEDGNHFDLNLSNASSAAKKLAEQLSDEVEIEAAHKIAAE